MRSDLRRFSQMHQIPIKILPRIGFPMNTLLVQRLLTAIKGKESSELLEESIHALFVRVSRSRIGHISWNPFFLIAS